MMMIYSSLQSAGREKKNLLAQPPLIASLTFPEVSQRSGEEEKNIKANHRGGEAEPRSQGEGTECTAGVDAPTPPAVADLARQKKTGGDW